VKRDRGQPESLGGEVARYLEKAGIAERVAEAEVVLDWPDRVGDGIAGVTRALRVSDGLLIVAVRSSAWLMELRMMQEELLRRLNAGRKRGRVNGIRFIMEEGG
jgi:predicted nucleic acid-binding Zn ribbon protein